MASNAYVSLHPIWGARNLAAEFDIPRTEVEEYLRDGDRLSNLNRAIDALEESQDVDPDENYGRIVFQPVTRRYRLTETAVELAR